jgi:hypothetical protein
VLAVDDFGEVDSEDTDTDSESEDTDTDSESDGEEFFGWHGGIPLASAAGGGVAAGVVSAGSNSLKWCPCDGRVETSREFRRLIIGGTGARQECAQAVTCFSSAAGGGMNRGQQVWSEYREPVSGDPCMDDL